MTGADNGREFRAWLRAHAQRKSDYAAYLKQRMNFGEDEIKGAWKEACAVAIRAWRAYAEAVDEIGRIGFSVSNRMRYYRLMRGLSQEDLALKCAVAKKAIDRVERGEDEPSLNLALRVSAHLGVPVGMIWPTDLGWCEEPHDAYTPRIVNYTDESFYSDWLMYLGWSAVPPQDRAEPGVQPPQNEMGD